MRYHETAIFLGVALALFFASEASFSAENQGVVNKAHKQTANGKGWTFTGVFDAFSKEYVGFAAQDPNPTLEIGAGRAATAAALVKKRQLVKNSEKIIVNDLSEEHFKDALAEYPQLNDPAVTFIPGHFPAQLQFPENSFNSILASRFFHFLSPEEWRVGLKKIHTWLKPGGKFYITTGTYFINYQKNNIAKIKKQRQEGDLWPASFPSGKEAYGSNSTTVATLVDREMLIRELKLAGFHVIKTGYVDLRPYLPESFVYDGREAVGAVAIK